MYGYIVALCHHILYEQMFNRESSMLVITARLHRSILLSLFLGVWYQAVIYGTTQLHCWQHIASDAVITYDLLLFYNDCFTPKIQATLRDFCLNQPSQRFKEMRTHGTKLHTCLKQEESAVCTFAFESFFCNPCQLTFTNTCNRRLNKMNVV